MCNRNNIDNKNLDIRTMTRDELIKHISYLQTRINLQKAIIDDIPDGTAIGYAVKAMTALGFDNERIEEVRTTMYGLLARKK